ncbi:hypothetical protein WJX82_001699 [Trebouxia sp. C0006]
MNGNRYTWYRYTGLDSGVQSTSNSPEVAAWKNHLLQSAYDSYSVELGYQVLSCTDDDDDDDDDDVQG